MTSRISSIQAGTKAQVLASMHEARLPISPGFVIASDAFTRFSEENDLHFLLAKVSSSSGTDLKDLSARIRQKIQEGEFSQSIVQEVLSAYIRMGEPRVMLSLSVHEGERIPKSSDAHLFGIQGDANLFFAIKKLWASFFQYRLLEDRLKKGLMHFPLPFALTVQSLPSARVSALLFTDDPTSSTKQTALIKAVYGEGALQDSLDGADYYWVKRGTGELYKEVLDRQRQQMFYDHASEREKETATSLQKKRKLTLQQLKTLAKIAKDVQQHFFFPQRMRVVLSGDSFLIVDHEQLHALPEQQSTQKKIVPRSTIPPTPPPMGTQMRIGMSYALNPAGHIPPMQHFAGHVLVSPRIFLERYSGKLSSSDKKILSHALSHALQFTQHHIQSAGIAYDFGHPRDAHDQFMVELATLVELRKKSPGVSLSLLFPAINPEEYKSWSQLCSRAGLTRSSHLHFGLKVTTPAPLFSLAAFCTLGLDSVCIDLDAVDTALHGSLSHTQQIDESDALLQFISLARDTANELGVELSFASTRTPTRAILAPVVSARIFEWYAPAPLIPRIEHIFEGE